MTDYADLEKRLREERWPSRDESVMACWDSIRSYFKGGDRGGSLPRDQFESIIDGIEDDRQPLRIEAADALASLRIERDLLTEKLQQIADFAPPTLPRYENAVNIIRDIQYVARTTVEALARGRDLSSAVSDPRS